MRNGIRRLFGMPERANLKAALKVANKWREASGQNILSAWLPAVPVHSHKCLLARAFNKNASVSYTSTTAREDGVGISYGGKQMERGSGRITLRTHPDSVLFAKVTGYELGHYDQVRLPDEIALVAWEFDAGEFSEYAVAVPPDE